MRVNIYPHPSKPCSCCNEKRQLNTIPHQLTCSHLKFPLHFPDVQISLYHQGQPITYDFPTFLQNKERQDINEEYFQTKLNIHPTSLPHLGQYTLRRVLQRNPSHRHIYSKIIHLQLNTINVNHRWGTSTTPNCPVCSLCPETWQHVLACKHSDMTRVHTGALATMKIDLIDFKTYGPLLDFNIDFFIRLDFFPTRGASNCTCTFQPSFSIRIPRTSTNGMGPLCTRTFITMLEAPPTH